MKRIDTLLLLLLLLSVPYTLTAAPVIYGGVDAGYDGGGGAGLRVSMMKLSRSIPLSLEAGGGIYYQDNPGDAVAARHIFINDNEGGTVEKYGRSWTAMINVVLDIKREKDYTLRLKGGPRHNWYTAHFSYIGDNESFDVHSRHWGAGADMELVVVTSPRSHLTLTAGGTWYVPATMSGHGTYYYSPDGVDDNPRNDYTYKDSNEAINQPTLEWKAMVGFHYRLF